MSENNPKKKKTGLKFISVIMSVLLWFYIVNQGSLVIGRNLVEVNLKYNHVPDNFTVAGPEKVSVKLWGAFREVGDIVAYVDLAGLDKGVHKVSVNLQPVKGAMFTSVQPDKVEVRIEDLRQHTVPVNYEVKRNPQTGYELGEVITSPTSCMVKGQPDAVDRVASVYALLDLGNIKDVASFKSTLQARDAHGRIISSGITLVPSMVEVYAVVEKQKSLKKLAVKPQFNGSLADGFRLGEVKSDPPDVSLLGDKNKVDTLTEILTRPIDISGKNESFSQEADLVQPEGVVINPVHVTVNIKIDKIDSQEVQ